MTMNKKNLIKIYRLGRKINQLYNELEGGIVLTKESVLLENFNFIKDYLNENNLKEDTPYQIEKVVSLLEDKKLGDTIKKKQVKYLREALNGFESVIYSYIKSETCLEIKTSLTINPKSLEKGAKEFISDDIWDWLNEITKNNLDESAKCLLCDIPTAAAFMAMRATEREVRTYYELKTEKDGSGDNWGDYTNRLKEKDESGDKKYDVDEDLLNHLEYLKRRHRDLAGHPEKEFSLREAEDIFNRSIATIKEIYDELEEERKVEGVKNLFD